MSEKKIELWGGIECTHNRVGDIYFDQLERSGHEKRVEDLELFAQLGISAIRYPVLWERISADESGVLDWSGVDERLARLNELRIRPIIGLVHHGSGPSHTSLVSSCFPEKLEKFAFTVAERYPWIDAYTPINEPLTTARFSGLYGFWYPHGRDNRTFALAVINQCRATVLAMKAVRRVNPQAKLIQTEDLGKTYSTTKLEYQANFENERRLLAFDLLCGRVDRNHQLWKYLRNSGIEESQIEWFQENACPPDVMGFNYYLTSERYLDEHIERYPGCAIAENDKFRYADVEAVRVDLKNETGLHMLLKDIWKRYQLPLALTEIHLGCTREEQLRWFVESWETAQKLLKEKVDIRAVTAWSLLGSYDWNSLVTRKQNHYESGVFDLRSNFPRPTALASLLKSISQGEKFEHPVLNNPGWWRRPERYICKTVEPQTELQKAKKQTIKKSRNERNYNKQLLITGATGTLGQAFAHVCDVRGIDYCLLSRKEMDISDAESVRLELEKYDAWALINCAGYVRVDTAENEQEKCYRENTDGAANLASVCERKGIQFLTFSSDLVFDGNTTRAYTESDTPAPLNIYGKSKAKAEKRVMEVNSNALVIRTSAFFGPWDEFNFLRIALRSLASSENFMAADDNFVSPTYVPDLVNASLDLLIDKVDGIWHLTQQGSITWADFARWAAELAKLDSSLVIGCSTAELNLAARRPLFSVLESERGNLLPSLEHGLIRFINNYKEQHKKFC
jgi:dTDP-4-dehydrorhamnose reductase